MTVVCAVAPPFSLGAWQGPFLPGVWWMLAKVTVSCWS